MQNTEEQFMASGLNYLTNKKSLRDIDIPPRKLLSRRASASSATSPENYMDNMYHHQNEHSPRVLPEETLFKKFLPYNTGADSDDEEGDPYAADHFRIYEFKVRKCTRSRSHDWTDCPFAHPGEKARRRCPRRYNYLGTVCADFRRGSCSRGDLCEFAHGVFECWLHPSRYRTEACKDGKKCQRKICFFAHTQRQLRVVPPEPVVPVGRKHHHNNESSHCCAHCRCHFDIHHTSPTSTLNIDLDNLSPPASPPFSPAISGAGFSPISRFADRLARAETLGSTHLGNNDYGHQETMNEYINNQSLNELMRSMEAMNMEDTNNEYMNMNSRWIDGGINAGRISGEYPQFDLSPTQCGSDMGRTLSRTNDPKMNNVYDETSVNNGLDLGWVNDLLT